MGLLESVRTHLISSSVGHAVGTAGGWPVFIGSSADDTDRTITLQFYGGERQDTQLGENLIQLFQVRVRCERDNGHAQCEAKWRAVFNALNNPLTISGVNMIIPLQSAPLYWEDDKKRPNMALNCRAVIAA